MALGQPSNDRDHLLRRLALAEHGFRHAVAKGTVHVDSREAQIFDGQVPEPTEGLLRGHLTGGHGLEQRSYFFAIHLSSSFALPLRNPWRSTVT